MKIAIVSDAWYPQINGVVTTLDKTMQSLEQRGHKVLCVHPGLFSLLIPCPTYPQIKLALFPGKRFAQTIDQFSPDCIHVVTEGPLGLACRRYCKKRNLAFTTSFTSRFDQYVHLRFKIPSTWIFRLMYWFHHISSCTMVSTVKLKQELESCGFSRVGLWPRGVDTKLFRPRNKEYLKDERPIFMYMGRIAAEKNIEDFLKLDLPGTKFAVGDGPDLSKLRKKYPHVRFPGAKTGDTLAKYLAAADVFAFPSRTDTFGLVMLEALACGVPVAAYPVRGPLDVIQPGETGYLDENLKKAALNALSLSSQACRRYAAGCSWENATDRFLDNLVCCRDCT